MRQISSNQALAQLKKQGLPDPLWVVTGDEPLLALRVEDEIRRKAKECGYTERKVFAFDGNSDYSPVIEALSDLSLFGEKQLIELRLLSGNPGQKTGLKALEALMHLDPSSTIAIVSFPALDWTQKKKDWFKNLCEAATVVLADPVPRAQLPAWIREQLKNAGFTASPEVLEFLAGRTEGNLLACDQEIQKLKLLAEPGELTLDAVRNVVVDVSRYDPEELSVAILTGDVNRISKIIDGLKSENTAIPSFLWILAEDLKMVIKNKVTGEQPRWSIAAPKRNAIVQLARRSKLGRLEAALKRYADVDKLSKGIKLDNRDEDPWTELKAAALMLAL